MNMRAITIEDKLITVARFYSCSIEDLKKKHKRSEAKVARRATFVAIAVVHRTSDLSQTEIGKIFDNRDHSTISHALGNINNLTYPGIEDEVRMLAQNITNGYFLELTQQKPVAIQMKYCDNQDLYGVYKMQIV